MSYDGPCTKTELKPVSLTRSCEVSTTEIIPIKRNLPERRKRVALGIEAGKSNRAIAKELGCDEILVRNDRDSLAMPVEDRPVKKPKKVRPARELSPEEIHDRRLKRLLAAADRWVAKERLQLHQVEYAVHEAGRLLYEAKGTRGTPLFGPEPTMNCLLRSNRSRPRKTTTPAASIFGPNG